MGRVRRSRDGKKLTAQIRLVWTLFIAVTRIGAAGQIRLLELGVEAGARRQAKVGGAAARLAADGVVAAWYEARVGSLAGGKVAASVGDVGVDDGGGHFVEVFGCKRKKRAEGDRKQAEGEDGSCCPSRHTTACSHG